MAGLPFRLQPNPVLRVTTWGNIPDEERSNGQQCSRGSGSLKTTCFPCDEPYAVCMRLCVLKSAALRNKVALAKLGRVTREWRWVHCKWQDVCRATNEPETFPARQFFFRFCLKTAAARYHLPTRKVTTKVSIWLLCFALAATSVNYILHQSSAAARKI